MANITRRECRFVFHKPKSDYNPDTHIVKEIQHLDDGTTRKELKIITNFKRPLWVTKEYYRRHEQKKEYEELSKLLLLQSTESDLATTAASRLGPRYTNKRDLRSVKMSPYVYGIDVNSRTYIKHLYNEKYGDSATPYEVCILDIEANTLTDEITIISISTKEKMYTVIVKSYLQAKITTSDNISTIKKEVVPKLEYLYDKYVPKTNISTNVAREYDIAENELHAIQLVMSKAHDWKPDFMAAWNIDYDVVKMVEVLNKYGVSPEDVFCDPSIPKNLRWFNYKQGPKQKVTASGKYKPVNPEEQWHTVYCPASFYWIDAMCGHRYVRVGGKSVPGGYSLDNVLNYEFKGEFGKLKFEDENSKTTKGIEWHQYMTRERPLEYITYNQWDVLSVLELDEKTKDLQQVLPMLSGVSNFDVFNSGPKRIVDRMHFFYLERGRVLGTKDPMADDKDLLGLGSWIVLLPSYRISDTDATILEGVDDTNIRRQVFDSDQVSGYPSNTQAANVSEATTKAEIIEIDGIPISKFRERNINMMFGKVNAIDYGVNMFNLPTMFELYDEITKKETKPKDKVEIIT